MKPAPKKERFDPFFQTTPWEIIYDDEGRVIGEVYKLPKEVASEGMWRGAKRSEKICGSGSKH